MQVQPGVCRDVPIKRVNVASIIRGTGGSERVAQRDLVGNNFEDRNAP
jgi:hypothetical protein